MKYDVTEEYIDALCPSGENDQHVRTETIEADSEREAMDIYRRRYHVDCNSELRCRPARRVESDEERSERQVLAFLGMLAERRQDDSHGAFRP